ncbi:MAG TPA: hypothetical protein V6C88_09115 [Chroococcidiopsis sp.]
MTGDRDQLKKEAEKLYIKDGLTQEMIAERLKVSLRTIERWASAGKWSELAGPRRSPKIISIKRTEERAAAKVKVEPQTESKPVSPLAGKQRVRKIDEKEIVEGAIASLAAILSSTEIDTRGVAGVASALIRCLEFRRKIDPPSVAEIAAQIVDLGVSPSELVKELTVEWQKRA